MLGGMVSSPRSEDLRFRDREVVFVNVRQALRGQGMRSITAQEEELVGDREFNQKLVKTLEGRGDVLPTSGAGEHSKQRSFECLNVLQSVQDLDGDSKQYGGAVEMKA